MNGVLIGLVALLLLLVVQGQHDPNTGRAAPSPFGGMVSKDESVAESIADEIRWAMADVVAACVEQPIANTAAGCQPGAPSGALITNVSGVATALPAYAAGDAFGKIVTYYIQEPGAPPYVAASWLPATGGLAARYCDAVRRDLTRMTGEWKWVAPYDAATGAAWVYETSTTAAAAVPFAVAFPAANAPLTDGCPVAIEQVDR